MFAMKNSKPHSVRKRMVSNIYSKSYLQSSPDVHKIAQVMVFDRLLPIIDTLANKQESVDVLELNFSSTMDFITAFIFGLGNGSNFIQDTKTRQSWLHTYQSRRPYRFWDGELPSIKYLSSKLGWPVVHPWVASASHVLEEWTLARCRAASTWTSSLSQSLATELRTPALVYDHLAISIHAAAEETRPTHPPELQIATELASNVPSPFLPLYQVNLYRDSLCKALAVHISHLILSPQKSNADSTIHASTTTWQLATKQAA